MIRRALLLALAILTCNIAAFAQGCPSGAWWCSGTYAYDGMGNIRAIGADIYVYDTAGRLVSGTAEVQRGGTSRQDYSYDAFGNRTAASRIAGSVDCNGGCEQAPLIDPVTNHITGNGAAYDDAGNLKSITSTVNGLSYPASYDYDTAGSMAKATAGSDVRQFLYTADDERIATGNGATWTWTVRGLDGKVLREFMSMQPPNGLPTSSWQWTKDYVWRDGLLLASITPTPTGGTATQHFHLDHLGTPRLVTGDNGVQLAIHAYYPFGAELNLGTSEQPIELMKFTGHERDQLASNPNTLDYMHARFEMGTMGRFLSVDPVLGKPNQPQSWNRYAYVMDNPTNRVDPTGLADKCPPPYKCAAPPPLPKPIPFVPPIKSIMAGIKPPPSIPTIRSASTSDAPSWRTTTFAVTAGVSAVIVGGGSASVSLLKSTAIGTAHDGVAATGSVNSPGLGINVGPYVTVGAYRGDVDDQHGSTKDLNWGYGNITGTLSWLPAGSFAGGSVGWGPTPTRIGFTYSESGTSVLTSRDVQERLGIGQ